MANVQKLKFMKPRGYGAIRFATGCVADVPEPWASRFLEDGTAILAETAKPEKTSKTSKTGSTKDR